MELETNSEVYLQIAISVMPESIFKKLNLMLF